MHADNFIPFVHRRSRFKEVRDIFPLIFDATRQIGFTFKNSLVYLLYSINFVQTWEAILNFSTVAS